MTPFTSQAQKVNMKQYITIKQLEELDKNQKTKLQNWWIENRLSRGLKDGAGFYTSLPQLSIGDMIEFLGDNWHKGNFICTGDEVYGRNDGFLNETMCDVLWETVKGKL